MKQIALTYRFYIFYALIFIVPASWTSSKIEAFVQALPPDSFAHYLASIGVFDTPTAIVLLFLFFWLLNNFALKLKYINQLIPIPNINGRYEGELISSHTEDNTQNGTYPVVIEIKQTLTNVNVFLYTERSCSYSLIASICTNYNQNNELVYVYQNKTSAVASDSDMRDHHGSAFLEIFDKRSKLTGYYFNNPRERGRYGKITVTRVGSKLKGKF